MKKLIFVVYFCLLGAALFLEYKRLTIKPWPAEYFEDNVEHFKYGSIGAEADGFPFLIWRELPTIFAEDIPNGFGEFGFITEEGHELPIGISVRRVGVERVGFNCGTCHTSTFRFAGETHLVLGAPANALDLQAYIQFLVTAASDKRLTADTVIESAETNGRPLSVFQKMILRFVVFPRLNEQADGLKKSLTWLAKRPAHGPGRTDAGNFWRETWRLEPEKDSKVGTVDFPSVWNQRLRLNGWFHWDGNNASLTERNISAALAGGAPEWLLENHAIGRISDWLIDLPPPKFPGATDSVAAQQGQLIYERESCGYCHDADGSQMGKITPSALLGTDPERTNLFDENMVRYFRTVGQKYSWQFRNYRVTDGYANVPLDGIWMRGPYLHNGSVPTLADLLERPSDRPTTFFRGCTDFDQSTVGFVCSDGFKFDTRLAGNSNDGHLYGTNLPVGEKAALIEYLKSL